MRNVSKPALASLGHRGVPGALERALELSSREGRMGYPVLTKRGEPLIGESEPEPYIPRSDRCHTNSPFSSAVGGILEGRTPTTGRQVDPMLCHLLIPSSGVLLRRGVPLPLSRFFGIKRKFFRTSFQRRGYARRLLEWAPSQYDDNAGTLSPFFPCAPPGVTYARKVPSQCPSALLYMFFYHEERFFWRRWLLFLGSTLLSWTLPAFLPAHTSPNSLRLPFRRSGLLPSKSTLQPRGVTT